MIRQEATRARRPEAGSWTHLISCGTPVRTIVSAPIKALPEAQANPSFHLSAHTTREEMPFRTGSRRKRSEALVDMARLGDELVRIEIGRASCRERVY